MNNYTLKGLSELLKEEVDLAQVTMNSKIFPAKRTYHEFVKSDSAKMDYFLHYDFIWIISRYNLFKPYIQRILIKEMSNLLKASQYSSKLKGIVMHTDFPIRKEVYYYNNGIQTEREFKNWLENSKDRTKFYKGISSKSVERLYNKPMWDIDNIILKGYNPLESVRESMLKFYKDLKIELKGFNPKIKIYLENTTKISLYNDYVGWENVVGSADFIKDFIINTETDDLFGLCFDTEHNFAVTGKMNVMEYIDIQIPLMIHLNPIPEDVLPKSLKDKHSYTTLQECSQWSVEQYKELIEVLKEKNIPFIRECLDEARLREQKQVKSW